MNDDQDKERAQQTAQDAADTASQASAAGQEAAAGQEEAREQAEAEWLRQYDALAERFQKIYATGKERSQQAVEEALERAREQLVAAEKVSAERAEKLRQFLARDVAQSVAYARDLGEKALERFEPSRLEAGALASLAGFLELAGSTMLSLSQKARQTITCHTGQITSAGTLTCRQCGQKVHLHKTGRVPPCPKCKGTEFTKSY